MASLRSAAARLALRGFATLCARRAATAVIVAGFFEYLKKNEAREAVQVLRAARALCSPPSQGFARRHGVAHAFFP